MSRTGRWGLVAALILGLPCPADAGDPPRGAAPLSPVNDDAALRATVDGAIARGLTWLKAGQQEDGHFSPGRKDLLPGATALGLLTLSACDIPASDVSVLRGLAAIRLHFPVKEKPDPESDVYSVALTLMALEAHYRPDATGNRSIPESDRTWIAFLSRGLLDSQGSSGAFGYMSARLDNGYWDNSNSQFAILGLRAARLLGGSIPATVWLRALDHWMAMQETTGEPADLYEDTGPGEPGYGLGTPRKSMTVRARGWTYQGGPGNEYTTATGSMTAGGVSSIAVCRDSLSTMGKLDADMDSRSLASLRDGLGWLASRFSASSNPPLQGGFRVRKGPARGEPMPEFHHYWLYGLERAGTLSGSRWIGPHEWYREGARHLVGTQSREGWWVDGPGIAAKDWEGFARMPLVDTCFALLFLKRASRGLAGGTSTLGVSEDIRLAGAPALGDGPFRDLFDAVFRRFRRVDVVLRKERAGDFVRMGIRVIPQLVLRLESAEEGVRGAAIDALRMTTGESLGFDPASTEEARSEDVAAWESWWFSRKGRLLPDEEKGMFRLDQGSSR